MCPGRPSRRWRSPAMTPMRTMVATTTVIDLARNRPYSSSASKGNSSRSCGAPMVTHWHRPGKTVAGPESGGGPPGETQGGQAVLGQSEGDVIDLAGCRQLFQTMIEADQGIGENFQRSEEHTSELQSRGHLVCRLLLEKKKFMLLRTL